MSPAPTRDLVIQQRWHNMNKEEGRRMTRWCAGNLSVLSNYIRWSNKRYYPTTMASGNSHCILKLWNCSCRIISPIHRACSSHSGNEAWWINTHTFIDREFLPLILNKGRNILNILRRLSWKASNKLNQNLPIPLYFFLSDKPFTFKQLFPWWVIPETEINKVYANYVLWTMQMNLPISELHAVDINIWPFFLMAFFIICGEKHILLGCYLSHVKVGTQNKSN